MPLSADELEQVLRELERRGWCVSPRILNSTVAPQVRSQLQETIRERGLPIGKVSGGYVEGGNFAEHFLYDMDRHDPLEIEGIVRDAFENQ